MSKIPKMCFDKILPRELRDFQIQPSRSIGGGRARAIMPINKRWPNNTELTIRFMGGSSDQHDTVANVAAEWEKHMNLKLNFSEAPDAIIRISFLDDGAWSFVGTDNLEIPSHASTMNFGFMDDGTILHEFGHALGLSHEHQNPDGGIEWNEDVVIQSLSGAPNFWNEAQIRHNVLNKYSVDQINGTEFDDKSIMLYPFPGTWTKNGLATSDNDALSATDIAFISSVYPKATPPSTVTLTVNEFSSHSTEIKSAGEEDLFEFDATTFGRYVVETSGNTDVVMKLFGPNNTLIAEDDDSGASRNSRVEADLSPGKHVVQVRHFNATSGTGDYSIAVSKK